MALSALTQRSTFTGYCTAYSVPPYFVSESSLQGVGGGEVDPQGHVYNPFDSDGEISFVCTSVARPGT